MAEQSGFFDAHLVNGAYDRVYLADHFAKYFASFIGNGVFGGKSDELIVMQKSTTSMSVDVSAGQGWINGYWYENDSKLSLAIDVADGVLNRIDSIVLRWDAINRNIRLYVKKGTAATNASAPALQRNTDCYELQLAEVHVKAGATNITQADIVDTRLITSVCGLVAGVVQQLDTEEFGIQLNSYIVQFAAEYRAWIDQLKISGSTELNALLDELNAIAADHDLVTLNRNVASLTNDVNILKSELGNVRKDLLWTNSSFGQFTAKTIMIDTSGYDGVEVLYIAEYYDVATKSTGFIPHEASGKYFVMDAIDGEVGSKAYVHRRIGVLTSTSVAFRAGARCALDSGDMEEYNFACIPYQVYGVKSVSQ